MRISGFSEGFLSASRIADFAADRVHPSIEANSSEFHAHRNFLVWGTLVSGAALLSIPAFLVSGGTFGGPETAFFLALVLPVFCSSMVSRTGQLNRGVIGALSCVAGAISTLCLLSGGLYSPCAALFCIVILEASLLPDARGLKFGAGIVAASMLVVAILTNQMTPTPVGDPSFWQMVALSVSLAYAFLLATRYYFFRQHNSRMLAENNRQLALISENTSDVVTCHDSSGNTSFVSPSARSIIGVSPKSLLDDGWFEKVHIQDRIIYLTKVSAVVNDGRDQVFELRMRCNRPAQTDWKWVEMHCRLRNNHQTNQNEVVSSTRDITALKEQQQLLESTTERAEDANEMQRRFLATMSHELRTPLNAILGFSDILQQELFGKLPDKRQLEYVQLIHNSGQHLLNVVNDLLDITRIGSDKYELCLEPFSISEVVDATLKMLQQIASENKVSISCEVSECLPEVVADRRSCKQILINLISNAIKFSGEGGKVRISADLNGSSFVIRVSDNGIGIAEDFLPKIGLPFMQADNGNDREYEGSGLGLSVVKGLIELHNGSFDVDSIVGEGTTITVSLPLNNQTGTVVPADEEKCLVNLNQRVSAKSNSNSEPKPTKVSTRKGDNRARVSA